MCVCLHVRWGVCSLRWRLYPPGPEPLGPIRGCKYFMRYDSAAQTLLNHRPLTIFSGYVPFGKVRNNEINKHSLSPSDSPGPLRPVCSSPANERQCKASLSAGKRKSLANTARLAANQLPQQATTRVFSITSWSLLLISSCSSCFCYACSGKIAISFVSTSQLDKAVVKSKNK